jgi:TonB family protein
MTCSDRTQIFQKLCDLVRENWFRLIPESDKSKKGKLAIEFAIKKDGNVGDMRLAASSGDDALDRAAWAGITASNPLPPLPIEFSGPSIVLRFRFFYHPEKDDVDGPENSDFSLGTQGRQVACDVLSVAQGVDFGPYLGHLLRNVRDNWYYRLKKSGRAKTGNLPLSLTFQKAVRLRTCY